MDVEWEGPASPQSVPPELVHGMADELTATDRLSRRARQRLQLLLQLAAKQLHKSLLFMFNSQLL